MTQAPSNRLTTLGAVRVSSASGEELSSVTAQPRRVALLSYLALARPRGFHTRDQLLSLFWPEYDDQRARNALSQAVHFLRRSLGADVILSGSDDQLRINADALWCDAIAFESALTENRLHEALDLYGGPFFEGFHISAAAPELDRWVESERDRLGRLYGEALRRMADDRSSARDFAGAVAWRRKLAAHDPLSSRAAIDLMRALVAAGEPESALQHARIFEALVRQELDSAPDPQFEEFVRSLKRRPPAAPNEAAAGDTPRRPPVVDAGLPTAAPRAPAPGDGAPRRRTRYVSLGVGLLAASLALAALAAWRRVRSLPPRLECIAVLPIQNLSRDSTLDALARSMTAAMITELMRYPEPRVIPPASLTKLEGTRQSLPEIGKALGCDGIVDARLTRNGRAVHVDVWLFYAPDERHLWASPFENDTSRTLVLQRAVSEAVARRVQAFVGSNAPAAQPTRHVDTLTYQVYVHGRDAFRSRSAPSLNQAVAMFKQAIDLDSTFAAAYAGLADAYGYMGTQGFANQSYLDSARTIATRALALDDKSSEAHTSMAWILASDGNWSRAEDEFKLAIRLQPDNALAHHWYALLLVTLDRREEALAEIRRAKELDPTSQLINGANMMIEFFNGVKLPLGNPGNVKKITDRTFPLWHSVHGVSLARLGRCGEAYDANRTAQELAPDNTMMMLGLVGVHLLCGDSARGHALLAEIERRPDARHMAVYIATVYAYERKPDVAFAWLDRAQWNLQTYYQLRVNTDLAPLRPDPRFAQLLRRLEMP